MILDVFRRAFPFDNSDDAPFDMKTSIQQVKAHLFLRDFTSAFAKQEYLDAYALRWSASRALGYTDIFLHSDMQEVWRCISHWVGRTTSSNMSSSAFTSTQASTGDSDEPPRSPTPSASASSIACIGGGGGAEVVACAAAARSYCSNQSNSTSNDLPSQSSSKLTLTVHAIDIADWSTCLSKLHAALITPPELSVYASSSAKAANQPFIPQNEAFTFDVRFSQRNILAVEDSELGRMFSTVGLCTIMFTLNELFATSISRTTAFLLALTDVVQVGAWLLVVDSPGSYSEVKLGTGTGTGTSGEDTKTRQYPMKWLLDHTLLDIAGKENNSKWKKHVSDDSRWFRLRTGLEYPIDLESMRYQIHLYRRIRA